MCSVTANAVTEIIDLTKQFEGSKIKKKKVRASGGMFQAPPMFCSLVILFFLACFGFGTELHN